MNADAKACSVTDAGQHMGMERNHVARKGGSQAFEMGKIVIFTEEKGFTVIATLNHKTGNSRQAHPWIAGRGESIRARNGSSSADHNRHRAGG